MLITSANIVLGEVKGPEGVKEIADAVQDAMEAKVKQEYEL